MELSLEYHRRVLDAAARGGLVLTVNNRLSRHLHALFEDRMRMQGKDAWRTPEICSLDGWMRRSLALLGEEGRLLGDFSVLRLWEEAIEADTAADSQGLLQTAATARRAMQAHRLLVEYRADLAGFPLTEDHLSFIRWRQGFRKKLAGGEWLDAADIPDRIGAALRRKQIPIPTRVLLVGFDEVSPQIRRLAEALTDAGSAVEEVSPLDESRAELIRIPAADVVDEVRRAARWVRHLLEIGEERIGIVVPGLQDYRSHIERIFSEEIDPEVLPGLVEEEARFSLSLGAPMSVQGMVTAALEILALQVRSPAETVGFLLRSPYLGGALAESHGRAALDRDLRSWRSMEVGLHRLKNLASGRREKEDVGALPRLAGICEVVMKSLAEGGKRTPGEWVVHFCRLLEQVGWPGDRPLSSLEFQVHRAWREKVLPVMVSLDAVCPPMERGTAVTLLRRLALETVFQPETPEGPVRVIGLLESAGLHFDHLWIMGLTDEVLPAPARPNPFIPVALQAARGMPHADAGRELAFARRTAGRLFAAAPKVVLSHPCRNGDVELRPSPLIAHVPSGEIDMAPTHAPGALIRDLRLCLERTVDEQAPALREGENPSGGTGILKDQALCPFRAFAHHRLHARALDRPDVGLDAGIRGTLLHGVLEEFWKITQSRDRLCALDEQALVARIAACVDAAIGKQFGDGRREISPALLGLERRRLAGLVREWLEEVDKKRPPFTVWKPEAMRSETVGVLAVDTRVDRIDVLHDGSRVILDYKTGRVDLADLFGDRLTEPQLPLYGIGEDEEALAGIAFARVRLGECGLKGVARSAELLPGVEAFAESRQAGIFDISGWAELLDRWRCQLEELSAEFVGGEAAVSPADPKKSCQYCDLFALCRIDEIALLAEDPA
jgi:probable DNA repair protein